MCWRVIFNVSRVLSILIAISILGCSSEKRPQQDGSINYDTYVASVDGQLINLGQVFNELGRIKTPGVSESTKSEHALNEVIYRTLARQKVDDYDNYDPKEVYRLCWNRTHEYLVTFMIRDLFASKVTLSDSAADSAYNANIDMFTTVARRTVRHLLISDNDKAWRADGVNVSGKSEAEIDEMARDRVWNIYNKIENDEDMINFVAKYSHDTTTKPQRGLLGPFVYDEMVKKFSKKAFSMKIGEFSEPFKTVYGYHIIEILEIEDKKVQSLDDPLRENIRNDIREMKEREYSLNFIDSLREVAEFKWNEELLKKNVGEYDGRDWLCIVNGTDTLEASNLHELEVRYATRNRTGSLSPEKRKELVLEKKVVGNVLASEARKRGYVEHDSVKATYEHFRSQEIVNRMYRDRLSINWKPNDEELKEYYDDHREDFMPPKPIKVQHILFEDATKATEVLDKINAGADFEEMALKYYPGDEDFRKAAFDLGWISDKEVSTEFYNAAWIASKGKVIGPIHSEWGYHLVKILDRKALKNFSSARNDIIMLIKKQKRAEQEQNWIENLESGKNIVRYNDILKQVDFNNKSYYIALADSLRRISAKN